MAVYKDKWNGYKGEKWRVACYYKDWKGERKKHEKRGFLTRREALAYEREFLAKTSKDIKMGFGLFLDIYLKDMRPQLKASTMANKENVIETHIRPYFENKSLSEINSTDVLQWQNELLSQRDDDGKGYSQTYLRTIQNQLNAIFNHAVKYYDLAKNPCIANKKMGKAKAKEMQFWTKEEYMKFIPTMANKTYSYMAFELLYWCGIRLGELRALTPADIDFETNTLSITKSYQRIKGEDVITKPKTKKSIRKVVMPDTVAKEMKDFLDSIYGLEQEDRVFPISKSYLHHEMDRGVKESGVKRIRIHDLRHSHVSLLIDMGFSAVAIGNRVGHESEKITYRYAHLFPSVQGEMAEALDDEWKEGFNVGKEEG